MASAPTIVRHGCWYIFVITSDTLDAAQLIATDMGYVMPHNSLRIIYNSVGVLYCIPMYVINLPRKYVSQPEFPEDATTEPKMLDVRYVAAIIDIADCSEGRHHTRDQCNN